MGGSARRINPSNILKKKRDLCSHSHVGGIFPGVVASRMHKPPHSDFKREHWQSYGIYFDVCDGSGGIYLWNTWWNVIALSLWGWKGAHVPRIASPSSPSLRSCLRKKGVVWGVGLHLHVQRIGQTFTNFGNCGGKVSSESMIPKWQIDTNSWELFLAHFEHKERSPRAAAFFDIFGVIFAP